MDNNAKLQAQAALQSVDSGLGMPFNNQEVHMRDTAFVAASTAVTNMTFFGTDTKDEMWKSADFPSNTQAFIFTHVLVDPSIIFNADAQAHGRLYKYFLKNSFLEIKNEGTQLLIAPLSEMVTTEIVPSLKNDPTAAAPVNYWLDTRDKFNNAYKFIKPWKVNALAKPSVKILVAKGLTTAAYDVARNPVITNNPTIASNEGNYVMVELKGIVSKVNG